MCTNQLNMAWKADVPSPAMKLVLVSLADQSNHDGVCWPSINGITERTGLARRTVITNIRYLIGNRFMVMEKRVGGLGGGAKSNVYTLTIESAANALSVHSESASNGSESAAPAPEPPLEPPLVYIANRGIEDVFTEYKAMRKQIKKPMNATSIKLLVGAIRKLETAGHNPADLLETATAKCWLSVYPPKEQRNGYARKEGNGTRTGTVSTPAGRGREAAERLRRKNNGTDMAEDA